MSEMSFSERTQSPSHWTTAKINDLCEFIVDCIHHTPELSDSPTGYFMVRTSDVGGGHVRLENSRFISKEVFEDRIQRGKPQWGDIIISREAPLGNVGQILTDENICLGQRLIHYRPNKDIVDIRYLLFALLSPMVQNQFRANEGRGSIVDNLLMQTAKDLSIPIPPLSEQQKIAAVLTALDAKIELNQRINAELESMAKTLYDYWFVQFDFPNEKDKPYKSAGGKMVWNEKLNKEVPEGWQVKSLRKVLKTNLGGTPSTKNPEYWNNATIPWLNSGDLGDFPIIKSSSFVTKKGVENSATAILPKGSVVISLVRYIRPSIIALEACANQSVVGILVVSL